MTLSADIARSKRVNFGPAAVSARAAAVWMDE
jgi:hypothetical protein